MYNEDKAMTKKIITDCDGVLLDWSYSFEKWMKFHFNLEPIHRTMYDIQERYGPDAPIGKNTDMFYLPRVFCNSSRIGSLKPQGDAVKYIKKLYEELGITLDVVTSLSLDPETVKLRKHNLEKHFGNAIDRIITLDTGADKDGALDEWRDTEVIWVEDKPENAMEGVKMGMDVFLIDASYNRDWDEPSEVKRVQGWREIYDYVIGE